MRLKLIKIISVLILIEMLSFGCHKNEIEVSATPLTSYTPSYPSYFPNLPVSSDNQLTEEGIYLGRKLYYDPILSNNGNSCSSCHNQNESFSAAPVNSLAHVNLGWSNTFLWNGKISGNMEDIMMFEVEQFFHTDISKLNNSQFYRNEFRRVFGVKTITSKEVAYALAQFFNTMISANSKYDQFLQHKVMLTTSEMNGLNTFTTEKGDCFHCHNLVLLTDNKFHNIGLDSVFTSANNGRYQVTGNSFDIGLFKTPTLRNIELTPPYMHDGRYNTLEQVVEHYNSQVKISGTLDPIMTKPGKQYGLGLTLQDKADLVAFLKTLTDSTFINNPRFSSPN